MMPAAAISRFSVASRRKSGPTARSRSRTGSVLPLKIAAKVDKVDEAYFRQHIVPLLNEPGIEYIGEINEFGKSSFWARRGRCSSLSTGRSRSGW